MILTTDIGGTLLKTVPMKTMSHSGFVIIKISKIIL